MLGSPKSSLYRREIPWSPGHIHIPSAFPRSAPLTPSPHSPNAGVLATAEADANRARNLQSTRYGGITRTHQPPRLRQEIPVPFPYRTLGLVNPCLFLSPTSYFISRSKSFLTLSSPYPILIRCPP